MTSIRILLLGALAASPAAHAEGLALNPGMWETTTTSTMPFSDQTQTETKTECMTETEFDPARMLEDAEGCELTKNELDGDTLDFEMACSMQGATATMIGNFQTDGETGSGSMDMTMNATGMQMNMSIQWTARRVGDC